MLRGGGSGCGGRWIRNHAAYSAGRNSTVSAVADNFEVRDVVEVQIAEDRDVSMTMLFEAGRSLEERMLAEQFSV